MLVGEQRDGTIIDHLEELRWVLIRTIVSLFVLFPLCLYFSDQLLNHAISFFCPSGMKLRFFSPMEPLFVKFKLAFYLSIFLALPYIVKQWWSFISPALEGKEKSFSLGFILFSWLLSVMGGVFALFLIMPLVMQFSFGFETAYLEAAIGVSQFISLLGMLVIGFGIMFQFPIAVVLLVKAQIVSIKKLQGLRSIVMIVILVVSAFLTPPDFVSQLLMGIPTYLLFEVGLFLARFFTKENKEIEI